MSSLCWQNEDFGGQYVANTHTHTQLVCSSTKRSNRNIICSKINQSVTTASSSSWRPSATGEAAVLLDPAVRSLHPDHV